MDYLPGYTGHVPYKKEIYGCTLGDINKIVMGKPTLKTSNFEVDEIAAGAGLYGDGTPNSDTQLTKPPLPHGMRTFYSRPPEKNT